MSNPARQSETIFVCFKSQGISAIFAELLESKGLSCRVINDPSALLPEQKIITEATYVPQLAKLSSDHKLLVGTASQLERHSAIKLTQPLTESKIESALERLLGERLVA